ncbi:MAG TPA: glycine cleavage T C-terminal barrel domain-containing protein [Roseiflexaceae bacterium]|nr:glycine cleavage T C-terminal barrel domain-containing protein [Roseiflexaceae bacterium]
MSHLLDIATSGYRAALEGVALADEGGAGRIYLRGKDRAALLQRLSTNDVARLKPGQGARTVLTTPIGRIIDVLTIHALEEALLLVASPGQGGPVWAHLKKNIFFNDQVSLEAAGRSHGQVAVYGPGAATLLEQLSGAALSELRLHSTAAIEVAGAQVLAARREPIGGSSFTLFPAADQVGPVRDALVAAGAAVLDESTLDILRVERGYGAFGRELSQEYIPLETGLLDAVSFTKGCYVGQEIIARMESRGRLAKVLRGLRLTTSDEGPKTNIEEGEPFVFRLSSLVFPAKLDVDGKEAGDLTSVVVSPRFGPIGLAYVRSAQAAAGTLVGIAGSRVRGEVVELPFDSLQPDSA